MAKWLDLALVDDEAQLTAAIYALTAEEKTEALESLAGVLGLSEDKVIESVLRLLVERARPLALPARVWALPVTSSDDPRAMIRDHFARWHVNATPKRMAAAARLYARFADEREPVKIGTAELEACGYRCRHCGLAFCNEQLERRGIVSPFGNRGRDKIDARKPHWNNVISWRLPTCDHIWPVSTYGDNEAPNLQVICRGCNLGKENALAVQQVKAWTGIYGRASLLRGAVVDWTTFYAHVREEPFCTTTGKGAAETELTVELIDPEAASVLGNLRTVESRGL